MQKFASFQVTSAVLVPADASPAQANAMVKTAHRHHFEYEPRPGFLYVRSRAISSRANDNYDEFPAEEIKKAYRTFVGKPVFVNHHNEDHRRARGVIIDAALHEDVAPDGRPDTWVELLHEIDAKTFPKLAELIIAGDIDRTSMGCDVAFSVCAACGNKASSPASYCAHIPRMKGTKHVRVTASGERKATLITERCYGLKFFENSFLYEPPADPTAVAFGVDTRGLTLAASKKTSALEVFVEAGEPVPGVVAPAQFPWHNAKTAAALNGLPGPTWNEPGAVGVAGLTKSAALAVFASTSALGQWTAGISMNRDNPVPGFKTKADHHYRMIGPAGFADFLETGVVRARQGTKRGFERPYFGKAPLERYRDMRSNVDYIAETPSSNMAPTQTEYSVADHDLGAHEVTIHEYNAKTGESRVVHSPQNPHPGLGRTARVRPYYAATLDDFAPITAGKRDPNRVPTPLKPGQEPWSEKTAPRLSNGKIKFATGAQYDAMTNDEQDAHNKLKSQMADDYMSKHLPHVDNIIEHFNRATSGEISQGIDWYRNAHFIARGMAEKHGVPLHTVAGLLSTYSPQQGWFENLRDVHRVLSVRRGLGGKGKILNPFGMNASEDQAKKADRLLGNGVPAEHYSTVNTEKKTYNFAHSIEKGDDDDADHVPVIDRHALSVAIGRNADEADFNAMKLGGPLRIQPDGTHVWGEKAPPSWLKSKILRYTKPKRKGEQGNPIRQNSYDHIVDLYRQATDHINQHTGLNLKPHQVQAITWIVRQRLNDDGSAAAKRVQANARASMQGFNEIAAEHYPDIPAVHKMTGYMPEEEEDTQAPREHEDGEHSDTAALIDKQKEIGVRTHVLAPQVPQVDSRRKSRIDAEQAERDAHAKRLAEQTAADAEAKLNPGKRPSRGRRYAGLADDTRIPMSVDTLREAECPVCGYEGYSGQNCQVCGYQVPPKMFTAPDTSVAADVNDSIGAGADEQVPNLVDPSQLGQDGQPIDPAEGKPLLTPDQLGPDGKPQVDPAAATGRVPQGGDAFQPGPNAPTPAQPGQSAGEPGRPGDGIPDLFCMNCGYETDAAAPQSQNTDDPTAPVADGVLAGDVCPSCHDAPLVSPSELRQGASA